jgi:transposase
VSWSPRFGTGEAFSKGRDFAAWLGLISKQISTGDRTILGKISKRGNRYLRVLFVQAGAGQTKPVFDVVLNFGFADRWKLVLQGTAQSLPEGVGPLSVS